MNRRQFIGNISAATCALTTGAPLSGVMAQQQLPLVPEPRLRFGFVTYLWGRDMKLPELIDSCEKSGLLAVETRTQHAHGVEPELSASQRADIRRRFADSPVRLIGYGSNCQFHEDDAARVEANIEQARRYIRLMHDCGGAGLKVKPNGFPKNLSREKTIEQIGKALNRIGAYGDDFGQEIRVEVHGSGTSDLEVMKAIFDVADHPNVTVCWNSNQQDLEGKGLAHNFSLVRNRFGATAHVRELDSDNYPYQDLFNHFVRTRYTGWVLLEARTDPSDKVEAMKRQKALFDSLLAEAEKNAAQEAGGGSGASRL